MKAYISLICGVVGLLIIVSMQGNILLMLLKNFENRLLIPSVYVIGLQTKILVVVLGLVAVFFSLLHSRSGAPNLRTFSKIGLIAGILGIILAIVPLGLLFW